MGSLSSFFRLAILIPSLAEAQQDTWSIDNTFSKAVHAERLLQVQTHPTNPGIGASIDSSGNFRLWDLETLSEYWQAKTIGGRFGFSNDGSLVVIGGECAVQVFSTSTGELIREYPLPTNESGYCNINWHRPKKVLFSQDDQQLFVAYSQTVFHIDRSIGEIVGTLRHSRTFNGSFYVNNTFFGVRDIRLSHQDRYLHILDKRDYRAYDLVTKEFPRTFKLAKIEGFPEGHPDSQILSADGGFSVHSSGLFLYIVNNATESIEAKIFAAAGGIMSLSLSADNRHVAMGSGDGTSRVFAIATGTEIIRLDDYRSDRAGHSAVWFDYDHQIALTGDTKGTIWRWRPNSSERFPL